GLPSSRESTTTTTTTTTRLARRPADTVVELASDPGPILLAPPADAERTPRAATVVALPFSRKPVSDDHSIRAVPDIRGLSLRAAVRALHSAGFRVVLARSQSTPTLPAAGTLLPKGSVIKLQHTP
ncbi:MAG TPA: PASTA domain-containing protein, partial [Gemmatimonadaceae bacterium]|nr:PASTA domain-containing protein [Gemmatimonadaceae bacterium]